MEFARLINGKIPGEENTQLYDYTRELVIQWSRNQERDGYDFNTQTTPSQFPDRVLLTKEGCAPFSENKIGGVGETFLIELFTIDNFSIIHQLPIGNLHYFGRTLEFLMEERSNLNIDLEGGLDDYNIEDSLGYQVGIFSTLLRRVLILQFDRDSVALSPDQYAILANLAKYGSMSISEIANSTFKDIANVSRMVKELIQMGLVSKVRSEKDRRYFVIQTTENGLDQLDEATESAKKIREFFGSGITAEEMERARQFFLRLNKNMINGLESFHK